MQKATARYSGAFFVDFEHISHLVQVFLLLTSVVNFEHVNAGWGKF